MEANVLIDRVVVGQLDTNCYVVSCGSTAEAVIIDPGADPERIWKAVSERHLTVGALVCTHNHWDHTGAIDALKGLTGAPLVVGELDAPGMKERPDVVLRDGDRIVFGLVELQTIHTPGHTPGGICLYLPGHLFSGDTLFLEDVGRSDLPGGDEGALVEGIRRRLFVLPDETRVYPGHDEPTTIGHEKSHNPSVK